MQWLLLMGGWWAGNMQPPLVTSGLLWIAEVNKHMLCGVEVTNIIIISSTACILVLVIYVSTDS